MITEQDLREAIAECQGQRSPNASTCIKLAAFLIIQREMYGKQPEAVIPTYSYQAPPDTSVVYNSQTEFGTLIDGKNQEDVWPIMDDLMNALSVVNPRLYNSVLNRLNQ